MFNLFKPRPYVEIARSFSLKKNLGEFENADFFCSAKREVTQEEASEASDKLLNFCRTMVMQDLRDFMESPELKEFKTIKPTLPRVIKKPFDWKDTPAGAKWLEAKAEDNDEHGAENGPRGGQFEEGESVSGQQ